MSTLIFIFNSSLVKYLRSNLAVFGICLNFEKCPNMYEKIMLKIYLSQSSNKHDTCNKSYTSDEGREESKDDEDIANMHVSNIDEFIRNDVVTVVSGTWS